MSTTKWDLFLSLLAADGSSTGKAEAKSRYTASALYSQARVRAVDLSVEEITQMLNESLVLLLRQGAEYTFDDGTTEIVYLLPNVPDVLLRRERARRHVRERIKQQWEQRVLPALFIAARTVFGAFLLVSLCVAVLAVLALLVAASSSSSSSHRGNMGGGMGGWFSMRRVYVPFRFWYWPVAVPVGGGAGGAAAVAVAARRRQEEEEEGMSLVEAIFSFVFGDFDSDEGGEEAWPLVVQRFLGAFPSHHKQQQQQFRAVQFCALVSHPMPIQDNNKADEQRMMADVLFRFQGRVVQHQDDGEVYAYEFPSHTPTPPPTLKQPPPQMYRQRRRRFSRASPSQIKLCIGLGTANLVLLALVQLLLLRTSQHQTMGAHLGVLAGTALHVAQTGMPLFVGYALVFLCLPCVRWWLVRRANSDIDKSNGLRELWRRRLADEAAAARV